MDASEDAKVAGSHCCEAAVSHLKGQGNQRRFFMTGKKPNVMLVFKNDKEKDMGIYRMFSLTSVSPKIWSKSFRNPFPALQRKGGD